MSAAGGWCGPAAIAAVEAAGLAAARSAATTTVLLEHAARRVPERPALLFLPNGRAGDAPVVLTHAALLDRVLRFAAALRGLGVARGEGVALLLPPRPGTFVALFGAEAATHAVPLNPMLSAEHLAALLRKAAVGTLVALGPDADYPGIWPKARELARMLPGLRLIRVGSAPESDEHGFDALPDSAGAFDERPAPADLAACFHTGGTTGAPKLVRHSHANQAHAAWFLGLGYGLGPVDAVLNGFPLFHVAGAICHGLVELAHGAAIVVPSQTGMRIAASSPTIGGWWNASASASSPAVRPSSLRCSTCRSTARTSPRRAC